MEVNKMGYNTNNNDGSKGQWSEKNNSSAAHGGLRHKVLFGSIDKQAPPRHDLDPTAVHSTMVQGQRNKKSSDRYGKSTVPTADVISLVENDFKEIREDIEEFTRLALNCEAFSEEKNHLQGLLSHICKSNVPIELRQEALRGILRTSCWPDLLRSVPGYQDVIGEFVEMRSVSA
tara:strand:+ start:57 stop:581 length:525 start_codon:yes stop_codon:yes gene_type:complete